MQEEHLTMIQRIWADFDQGHKLPDWGTPTETEQRLTEED